MEPRMKHVVAIIPEALPLLKGLAGLGYGGGVPAKTIQLVNMRVSQINGCSFCVGGDTQQAKNFGETDERLFTVAAWRHAPYFTEAERAALALAECMTRFADRPIPVPDDVWNEATGHFDEKGLATLLLAITTINTFNRLNSTIGLVAGTAMPWS